MIRHLKYCKQQLNCIYTEKRLFFCFVQICILFPGGLPHHQKQEKDQDL